LHNPSFGASVSSGSLTTGSLRSKIKEGIGIGKKKLQYVQSGAKQLLHNVQTLTLLLAQFFSLAPSYFQE
jgi:hypothetical protein